MAVGRISGPLLKSNLIRNGIDLAFETDLLYLDVTNNRVGIKNSSPQYALDVTGTTKASNTIVDATAEIGDITVSGNTISTSQAYLNMGTFDNVIYQNRARIDSIDIEGNTISSNASNTDIQLSPNGTGIVDVLGNVQINGNLTATGNLTLGGNIIIGDDDAFDNVTFNARAASDIIPSADNTYALGSDPASGGAQWNDVWVNTLNAGSIDTNVIVVDGVNLVLRQGNILYVAENGNDSASGTHQNDPYATIKHALSQASAGDTVYVYPGVYTEIFPLTVPVGVAVKGNGIRSVKIVPTTATRYNDCFLMNGESTVEDLTVADFYSGGNYFEVTARTNGSATVNVGITDQAHTYVSGGTVTFEGPKYYPDNPATQYTTTAASAGSLTVNVGVTAKQHTYNSGGTVTFGGNTYNISNAVYTESTGVFVVTHDGPDAGTGTTVTFENILFDCDPDTANITGATYTESTGVLVFTHDGGAIGSTGAKAFLKNLTFSCSGTNQIFPNNGYAFRFATDFQTTSRSPYIKNISVITKGSSSTLEDPRGFNAGDAGKGAYVDGAYATANSKEAAMLFHSATFIVPGVDAIVCTNGVRIEWLNSFTYFANKSFNVYDSNAGFAYNGKTKIRLSGITGTFGAGETVTFTSTDSSTVKALTIESVINNEILVVDGKDTDLIDFDTTPASISSSGGATATTIENVDVRQFGAEIRMIGSASVYGNFGLVGDGPGVIIYAIGHNLAYIGTGKEVTNEASEVIQANEIVETNGAKVRFNSVDHKGDFRVGDLFYVNQDDGSVQFALSALNIDLTSGLTITTGSNSTFINGEKIDTGNLRISGNTIESLSGPLNFDSGNSEINFSDNVNITGDLDVTGNVTIGGNITLGDQASDGITINAGINSDLIPDETSTYSLGSTSKLWSDLFVDRVIVDDIEINTNYITTRSSNSDLELRANGTGDVLIPSNDFVVDNDVTVNGNTALADTNVTGTLTHVGNYVQTGNFTITGQTTISTDLTVTQNAQFENIDILGNVITTSDSNSDLELRANGTGTVSIPENDVEITQNLNVLGNISADSITTVDSIQANSFTTGDIKIDDNFITTTLSNSNLELRANGTGSIVIDEISINDATISSVNDLTLEPQTENVIIDGTGSLKLPVGSTGDRPSAQAGQLRFNNTLNRFEGYNGTNWIKLDGLQDVDGDTRVTAELTEGANDNTIRFYVSDTLVADIDSNRLRADKIVVDDITIDGDEISTSADMNLSASTGNSVIFENLAFDTNTITNTQSGAVTNFVTTGQGYVQFDGATGVVLPVGDNTTRPSGVEGMIRFNTEDSRVELYDGTSWVSVAGASGGISFADAENIAIEKVLIFG